MTQTTPTCREPFDVSAWREAMEGVSAGPWRHYRAPLRPGMATINEVQCRAKAPVVAWSGFDDSNRKEAQHERNARWIARCSPAGIAKLLCEIERLQALENGPAVLADATNHPPLSDLSSLRKGAEVARALLVKAHEYLSGSNPLHSSGGHKNMVLRDEIASALVSGSREDGA